jgi:hypothetical protein
MKVICVNNHPERIGMLQPSLTIDKMYEVIDVNHVPFSKHRWDDPSGPFYLIKDDEGVDKHFPGTRFRDLTPDEKRELKLQELGI